MTKYILQLIENNKEFVAEKLQLDPEFFIRSSEGQSPKVLWIGCADSRVPPNEITKTNPGDIFVHRNIANLVVMTDMNVLSVLQYAVEVLKVEHIIICGHYGCGGVKAAMGNDQLGLIDNWLSAIKDTQSYYWKQLGELSEEERFDRLVELNVIEQIHNVGKTNIVKNAWKSTGYPYLHGWVYDLKTGLIKIQTSMINSDEMLKEVCKFELVGN